ncbi:hypothetical protein STANM309S_04860 [Streptomyces tanashiensis]
MLADAQACLARACQGVVGVEPEDGAHGESGVPEHLRGGLGGVGAAAAAGGGIDEEGDVAGHERSPGRSPGGPYKLR